MESLGLWEHMAQKAKRKVWGEKRTWLEQTCVHSVRLGEKGSHSLSVRKKTPLTLSKLAKNLNVFKNEKEKLEIWKKKKILFF